MAGPDGRLARALVAYYGLVEVAHIGVLALAGLHFARTGTIGFPAPPPPGGWNEQLVPFFVAMGAIDAINVGVAWAFVYGYFARTRWRWPVAWVSLSASTYSAAVFAWGTIASGAWGHRPVGYLFVAAAFVPVGVLAVLCVVWGLRGQLQPAERG
jgi:hypothetical protein